jgi:hypothetical protein
LHGELGHRFVTELRFSCHVQVAVEDEYRLPRVRLNLDI